MRFVSNIMLWLGMTWRTMAVPQAWWEVPDEQS